MTDFTLSPEFINSDQGRIYTCHYQPNALSANKECLIIVPPLAEEMNRCRYMCTMLAQQLMPLGIGCLLLDPYGTGDSEGDFGEMTWEDFTRDIIVSSQHMTSLGYEKISLLGIRLGALHALEAASEIPTLNQLLFWQPITNGKTALTQFLRIRIAAALSRNEKPEAVSDFELMAENGKIVEVAGYDLSASYFHSMKAAKIENYFDIKSFPIGWFTSIASAERKPPKAEQNVIAKWQEHGAAIEYQTVVAPPYWQVHERTLAPQLVEQTIDYLRGRTRGE